MTSKRRENINLVSFICLSFLIIIIIANNHRQNLVFIGSAKNQLSKETKRLHSFYYPLLPTSRALS